MKLIVLMLSASLEKRDVNTPLATAVIAGAKEREVSLTTVNNFNSITGKGVSGEIDNKQVALGQPQVNGESQYSCR